MAVLSALVIRARDTSSIRGKDEKGLLASGAADRAKMASSGPNLRLHLGRSLPLGSFYFFLALRLLRAIILSLNATFPPLAILPLASSLAHLGPPCVAFSSKCLNFFCLPLRLSPRHIYPVKPSKMLRLAVEKRG